MPRCPVELYRRSTLPCADSYIRSAIVLCCSSRLTSILAMPKMVLVRWEWQVKSYCTKNLCTAECQREHIRRNNVNMSAF